MTFKWRIFFQNAEILFNKKKDFINEFKIQKFHISIFKVTLIKDK